MSLPLAVQIRSLAKDVIHRHGPISNKDILRRVQDRHANMIKATDRQASSSKLPLITSIPTMSYVPIYPCSRSKRVIYNVTTFFSKASSKSMSCTISTRAINGRKFTSDEKQQLQKRRLPIDVKLRVLVRITRFIHLNGSGEEHLPKRKGQKQKLPPPRKKLNRPRI